MLNQVVAHVRANVVAYLALFLALGVGTAWALERNSVKSKHIAPDAVRASDIDFGVRSQVMLATFNNLGSGTDGGINMGPVGVSGMGGVNEMFVPQTFIATGLRINLEEPLPAGTREFWLRYYDYDAQDDVDTELRCEIETGEQRCQSNARARVPAGTTLWFEAANTNTINADYAEVGWRAVLP
jgi:hypothetical protein